MITALRMGSETHLSWLMVLLGYAARIAATRSARVNISLGPSQRQSAPGSAAVTRARRRQITCLERGPSPHVLLTPRAFWPRVADPVPNNLKVLVLDG
jgi:hypothetical protein